MAEVTDLQGMIGLQGVAVHCTDCIHCLCETVDTISLSTVIVTGSRRKIHTSAPDLLA